MNLFLLVVDAGRKKKTKKEERINWWTARCCENVCSSKTTLNDSPTAFYMAKRVLRLSEGQLIMQHKIHNCSAPSFLLHCTSCCYIAIDFIPRYKANTDSICEWHAHPSSDIKSTCRFTVPELKRRFTLKRGRWALVADVPNTNWRPERGTVDVSQLDVMYESAPQQMSALGSRCTGKLRGEDWLWFFAQLRIKAHTAARRAMNKM